MLKPLPTSSRVAPATSSLPAPPPAAPIERLASIPATGPVRVLDFDIENRPLSYWIPDRPTAEVTAIAWAWTDRPDIVECHLLRADDPRSMETMLSAFLAAYQAADMVTGHYIRRHDLGIVQAALIENNLPSLGEKLTSDTKLDLAKFQDLPKTQEALCEMLGVHAPKEHMTQRDWREANRLTEDGRVETYRRVVGDVQQHMQMREALLERRLLGAPKIWRPGGIPVAA